MATTAPAAAGEMHAPAADDSIPMRTDAARMARLREAFTTLRYDFAETYGRWRDRASRGEDPRAYPLDNAVDVLSTLFLSERRVPVDALEAALPAQVREDLEALDLLRTPRDEPGHRVGRIGFSSIVDLWLAADNGFLDPGEKIRADVVFDALTSNTQQFLTLLPLDGCDAFLELCSGTGVAALSAAKRGARHAWGIDITERSTRFAEWNREFNGIANATMLQGDLYEPVKGLTFDRIVAHPPYVPNAKQEMIFRDGGADGEQISRRIIEELPTYLRPGGRYFSVCLASDRADRPLEQRLRDWLGPAQEDFDVLVVELAAPRNPTAYFAYNAYRKGTGFADVEERHKLFQELGVKQLVYVAIVLERRAEARPVFTSRRQAGDGCTFDHILWAIEQSRAALDPQYGERLAETPIVLADQAGVTVRYQHVGGALRATESKLEVLNPFVLIATCPPWVASFAGSFLTPAEPRAAVAAGVAANELPHELAEGSALDRTLRSFVGAGIFHAPGAAPPPPRAFEDVL